MRHRFILHHLLWIVPAAVVAVAVACTGTITKNPTAATTTDIGSGATPGPGSGLTLGPVGSGSSGIGLLTVTIKDGPFSEAKALLVTFSEVSVHRSGLDGSEGDWVTLPFVGAFDTRTCDLKRLVAATDVLGTAPFTAGHYTQLRLTVASATIYTTATTTGAVCGGGTTLSSTLSPPETGISVDVPSGTLKLNREFSVAAGGATTILLDFDGDKSIHETGNGKYKMTPVISVVSVQ